jgi:hypothetical protein
MPKLRLAPAGLFLLYEFVSILLLAVASARCQSPVAQEQLPSI